MPCIYHETAEEIRARKLAERAEREHAVTGPLIAKIDIQAAQIAELEAMLCGVFSLLEAGFESHGITFYLQAVLEKVDWAEAGVSMTQAKAWWADHKAHDEARKRKEAVILAAKRAAALAKLTPSERELLGV
jgi:hypothetical protein